MRKKERAREPLGQKLSWERVNRKGWKPVYHSGSSNIPRGPQVSSSRDRGPAGDTACHSPSFHTPSHSQAQPDRLTQSPPGLLSRRVVLAVPSSQGDQKRPMTCYG